MSRLEKYPQYKESGVEWMGEIPEHWEVRKLKTFTNFINRGSTPSYVEKSDVYIINQATFSKSFFDLENIKYTNETIETFTKNRGRVFQDDLLIASTGGGVLGKVAYFDLQEGNFIADSHVTIIRTNQYANNKFYYFLLQINYDLINGILAQGSTNQTELQKDWLKDFLLPFPPLKEQTAIATFLNTKTEQLDTAITQKEQLIELLKERRQILIHDAVTKGVDSIVKMKASGVEWISEIPEHWEILPGLRIYKENKTKNIGMIEDVVLSLSYGKIVIKPKEKLTGLVPESFETYQIVKPNDIIVRCMDLQNDKTSLRTAISRNDGIITSAYLNLNVVNNFNAEYLNYYLHVLDITKVLYKFGTGLRQNLSYGDFKRLAIVIPPLQEQQTIVNFIEENNTKIDHAITLQQQQIVKLKEYKTTLIDSVVTGKVRII